MKYIKLFENNEFKRYCALRFPTNIVIVEVCGVRGILDIDNLYNVRRLYIYHIEGDRMERIGGEYKLKGELLKYKIIYQSDSIDDVLENVPVMVNVNKYNL